MIDEKRVDAVCAEVAPELLLAINLFAFSEGNPEVRAGRLDVLAYIQRRAGMHSVRRKNKGAAAPAVETEPVEEN